MVSYWQFSFLLCLLYVSLLPEYSSSYGFGSSSSILLPLVAVGFPVISILHVLCHCLYFLIILDVSVVGNCCYLRLLLQLWDHGCDHIGIHRRQN